MASRKNKKASRSSSGSRDSDIFCRGCCRPLRGCSLRCLASSACAQTRQSRSRHSSARFSEKAGASRCREKSDCARDCQTKDCRREEGKLRLLAKKAATKKSADTDVDALTARYQQRALDACLYAEESGVLNDMRTVSSINGIYLEHLMTLAIFESNMGALNKRIRSKKKRIAQVL